MKMYLTPKTYSLTIAMALSFFSCKKEPVDTLPAATHKGKNTFGCLIDGTPFIAEVKPDVNNPAEVSGFYIQSTNFFGVEGKREQGNGYESVSAFSYVLHGIGTYPINVPIDEQIGYWSSNGKEYYFDINNPGTMSITYFNPSKNIISGTFQFTLVNSNYADSTMVITDGRFDIIYY